MIINYLTLENFRQFADKQTIKFKTSEDKKVTLIIADSGFGKTTLINSFSWIFYGKCKYANPLNDIVKSNLKPYEYVYVTCTVNITHHDKEYTITRSQKYTKMNIKVDAEQSNLEIDIKDEDGTTREERGRIAEKTIKELMPSDLFPYFFLEGEDLQRVGLQMSKGKSGNTKDFVQAIRGLLGFNHLYEASKHLTSVSKLYDGDIIVNSKDDKLNSIISNKEKANNELAQNNSRLETIEDELTYNISKSEEKHEQLLKYGDIAEKQKRTKKLCIDLQSLKGRINDQKRYIFKRYSASGYNIVLNALLDDIENALEKSDSIDKGVPGLNAEAIEYLLTQHKCICGHDLDEKSVEWKKLNDLMEYLPPNSIGFEINQYKKDIKPISKEANECLEEFKNNRTVLNTYINDYNSKVNDLNQLNEEISGVNVDLGTLKEEESNYNEKIIDLRVEKKKLTDRNVVLNNLISNYEKEQKMYDFVSDKISKLSEYKEYADYLNNLIINFCSKRENEKRIALEASINDIFKDFYKEQVKFTLDEKYVVQIETASSELSNDFASGGQQVALAFAFIGAIIKLYSQKDTSVDVEDEDIEESISSEVYPLILDAPTSNFGMKQMKSFADIMPNITNQLIVFINDKDGPILKKLMGNIIDSEWSIDKIDTYHSIICMED